MHEARLTNAEVIEGFRSLSGIYGHVPPLIMWRAWELAAYRRLHLPEPVLDVGCGDGRFFRMAFPDVRDVAGIDLDEAVVDLARRSDVYRTVYRAPAHAIPVDAGTFASIFANCAIEHMDHLGDVLSEIHRVLRPGGVFLMSVVSETFVSWAPLRELLMACGADAAGNAAQARHESFHHLVNAFPRDQWVALCERAGFRVTEWTPIVQGASGWVFLLLDQLWHMERNGAEFGERFAARLLETPNHVSGQLRMLEGLLEMSAPEADYAGLILRAEK